jgi:tetratricopeptide (TPR) repeat protein
MDPIPKFCSRCGKPLFAGVAFCSSCGIPISDSPESLRQSAPASRRNGARAIRWGAGLVLLAAAAAAGIFSMRPAANPVQPASTVLPPPPEKSSPVVGSSPEVPQDPSLEAIQKLRFLLISQMGAAGRAAPAEVAIEGDALVVTVSPESNSEGKIREAKDALPILLLAYGALGESGARASKVVVRILLPEGDTLVVEADGKLLARYLAKEIPPADFAAAAVSRVIPWEPAGQTRDEILNSYLEHGRYLSGKLGRYDLALPMFREVLQMDPAHPGTKKALGVCLYMTGDYRGAIPNLKEEMSDGAGKIDVSMGLILSHACSLTDAHAEAARIAALTLGGADIPAKQREALLILECDSLLKLERYAEAGAAARAYLELSPGEGAPYWFLARALSGLGKAGEALPQARQAVALKPGDAGYLYTLAVIQKELKDYRESAGSYEAVRQIMKQNKQQVPEDVFLSLSFVYAKTNDLKSCAGVAAEGLKLYPASKDLQTNYKIGYKAQLKSR